MKRTPGLGHIVLAICFGRGACLYRHACRLLALVILVGPLVACGPQVLIGPRRSDSISLPQPVWIVAERSDESAGYVPGDPFDVYWIAQDGQLRRVTNHLDRNPEPSWSPDGKTVAFWVDSGRGYRFYYHLYTADSSGANMKPLTTQVGSTRSSSSFVKWSPKGNRLAFLAEGSEKRHLYVIDKNGSNLVDLVDFSTSSNWDMFNWSPNGERIAAEAEYEGYWAIHLIQFAPELEIVTLAPHSWSTRSTTRWSPVWSPDGRRIAYFSAAGVTVIDVDTRMTTVLTDDFGYTSGPLMWSPDGNWIAFVARSAEETRFECQNEGSATAEYLYLLASDGSVFTQLTPIDYNFADWAPDSEKLAFTLCNDIYTISIKNDADPQRITSIKKGYTGRPKWSSDGSMILFTIDRVHVFPDSQLVGTLYAIKADGSNQLTLTDGNTNVHQHGWLDK